MQFQRLTRSRIQEKLFKKKAIIVYGPRQVGKTTLVHTLLAEIGKRVLELNCDNPDVRELLTNQNQDALRRLAGNNEIVFIDEAQRITNIGLTVKLFVDTQPGVQVIASGSSAMELANEISEPLTGRKFSFRLFPISIEEHGDEALSPPRFKRELEHLLIFGSYPEVLTQSGNREKEELIRELAGDALFKDILAFQKVKNPSILRTLLKALAFQIGSEVSSNELAGMIGIDKNTVESYIDLLEKNFIVQRINSFSRNLRNELKKSKKVYFVDLGIRNALISNFNPISRRDDIGGLWENYCIMERIKYQEYHAVHANNYFWRTYSGQEVDWVEEREGNLFAYEMKWGTKKIAGAPKAWAAAYPDSNWQVVSPDNGLTLVEYIPNAV